MGRNAQRRVPEGTEEPEDEETPVLRISECRSYMRRTLAAEFAGILRGFVREAKGGSAAHMRLAHDLLEPPKKKRAPRKGSAAKMLEKLAQR